MWTMSLKQLESVECSGYLKETVAGVVVGACAIWTAYGLLGNVLAYTNPVTGTAATILNVGCGAVDLATIGYGAWNIGRSYE